MRFDDIKKACEAKTSESMFGIDLAPAHQCQFIDKMIERAKGCERYAKYLQKTDDVSECHSTASDIEWDVSYFHGDLEKLREAIEGVRAWGEGWKSLAKDMVERHPESLPGVLADKYFEKFELSQTQKAN
jgi:hypothetical protein